MINILIYGFTCHKNLGDTLFEQVFKSWFLEPYYNLTFTNYFTKDQLNNCDVVFMGGGSFLDQKVLCEKDSFDLILTKKIFYIGVGAETQIHSDHETLIKAAKLVAIRNEEFVSKVQALNLNTTFVPDLVYSLSVDQNTISEKSKSVLFIPNIYVVPIWTDPNWKHSAWNYFKSEVSQFLDEIVDYDLKFFPMSTDPKLDDKNAAYEIINMMKRKSEVLNSTDNFDSAVNIFSKFDFIITQRYHGIVLAEMLNVPYISLYHHDKLKNCYPQSCPSLNYYGVTKDLLGSTFEKALKVTEFNEISKHKLFKLRNTLSQLINY